MKNDYLSYLKTSEKSKAIQELPGKKRGWPLLLGEQLDKQVRDYILYLRSHGCIIYAHVVIAVSKGIIMGNDSNLLYSNGGSLALTKDWARNMIINCDHAAINYVPVSSWTMEEMGSKCVEISGKDDKRQLTVVFGCSISGDFLPPQ